MIVGYRGPTDAELQAIYDSYPQLKTIPVIHTDNGQVVLVDLAQVERLNPGFLDRPSTEQNDLLRRGIIGVSMVIPLIPIESDDVTGQPIQTSPSGIGIGKIPAITPTPIPITPVPVQPPPPVTPPVSLNNIIQISKQTIDRQYVKDSMITATPETLTLRNITTNTPVNVQIQGVSGVIFTPASFTVNPLQTVDVVVSFNMVEINKLPEGLSTIRVVVNLTANSGATRNPPFIDNTIPFPGIPNTPTIPSQIPIETIPTPPGLGDAPEIPDAPILPPIVIVPPLVPTPPDTGGSGGGGGGTGGGGGSDIIFAQ